MTTDNYCKILNTYINVTNMQDVVTYLSDHVHELSGQYICVANVHTTIMAYRDRAYRRILNESALTVPDGKPLSIMAKVYGLKEAKRVAGPDLMQEIFSISAEKGFRHFFYGSTPDTISKLCANEEKKHPGLNIVGAYAPPFRALTAEEKRQVIEQINQTKPDFIWVGLGAPRQELWMYEFRGLLNGLMIGVGAGFDFSAGTAKRAPRWMQEMSLEWFFRLMQDPKRLWKRYATTNILFFRYLFTGRMIHKKRARCTTEDKVRSRIENRQDVFIVGSKGIPASYGGFETFVEKLTEYRENPNIHYHVACMDHENKEEIYHDARCFHIKVPKILGAAKAVYYDYRAMRLTIRYIKEHQIEHPIVYILACRIGPFMRHLRNKVRELGGTIYVNPDGHEWKRSKWNRFIQRYWKYSERLMVRYADLVICDAKLIEHYIQDTYSELHKPTKFIAYGAETPRKLTKEEDSQANQWFLEHQITPNEYYLIVGRFVPENNYYTILKEFISSSTKKDLVIVSNVTEGHMYLQLERELEFEQDSRVKFVGTVYDNALLQSIRMNAFAYIHGHEVGGTNPSLLEALSMTKLNLLYNSGFNREVAKDAALYWGKNDGNLCNIMQITEMMSEEDVVKLQEAAIAVIDKEYRWNTICEKYERLWM